MKKFILGFLILMTFSTAFSQKIYFIYLQSEPEQSFYLKMNEKIHSSTATGYLILSRLKDSSYAFSIGFPQNKWPEQKFSVDVKAKDHGYLLKNFGEKGWGLFDLQTMTIQMAIPNKGSGAIKMEPKKVSDFTAILSKAADDPSLRERPVAVALITEEKAVAIQPAILKEEVKPGAEPPLVKQEKVQDIKKDDSSVAKENKSNAKETSPPVVIKQDPPPVALKPETAVITTEQPVTKTEELKSNPVSEYRRSVITKKAESSTSEGFGLTFLDEYDGKKDTIRIIIPNPKMILPDIKESSQEDKKFLDLPATDTERQTEPENKKLASAKPVEKSLVKPVCQVASENDFMKLRRKMAAENSDDGMIDEAKRIFKTKCFTVTQLKNLGALFLNDHGRYNFFDAAYTHVSDKDNFSSLSSELKDEYYINRFKAMLR